MDASRFARQVEHAYRDAWRSLRFLGRRP
jgi:hypothetical protein